MNINTLHEYWVEVYRKANDINEQSISDKIFSFFMEEIFDSTAVIIPVAYYEDGHNEWIDMSDFSLNEQIRIYEEQYALNTTSSKKIRICMWNITAPSNDGSVHKVYIWKDETNEIDGLHNVQHIKIDSNGSEEWNRMSQRDYNAIVEILKSLPTYKKYISKQ